MAQKAGVEYLIFARKDYAEPLRHIGQWVGDAPSWEDFVGVHGGEWLEVVLVPNDRVRWVIRERGEEVYA